MNGSALLFVLLVAAASATPAIERQFKRIVESNGCLSACMAPVQQSGLELTIFKRANYSDHLLRIDEICSLIGEARGCIDRCGIPSNPEKPSEWSRSAWWPKGNAVHDMCRRQCNDFEAINERIRLETATLKPEDAKAAELLVKESNDACTVLKCHARCSVGAFNERCGMLANGQLAGDLIRSLVEDVLHAHRADLEAHGLVEAMQKNSQPACNHFVDPLALFDSAKDVAVVEEPKKEQPNAVETVKDTAQRKLSFTLGQMSAQLMAKQMEVLEKQERNLDQEFEKTNWELARRLQKFQQQQQPAVFYRPMF
ncbi:hypothetical protein M3Y99_01855300 [Aphelenchoides fujianensis]|nr:hypothetical protein M3Y99_01855300 [Aphelenchoides fujianensis]